MRIFAIADASKRKAEPIGILAWWPCSNSEQGRFLLQLTQSCKGPALPLSVSFCVQREARCATAGESEDWVRSRIVPESRHNIGAVLQANGLSDYDEVSLLAACNGRSSDDDLLTYELAVPDGFASSLPFEAEDADQIKTLPALFADEVLSHVKRERHAGKVRYAFVALGDARGKPSRTGLSPHEAEDSTASNVSSLPNAAECIAEQIRSCRRDAGLTQAQLASRARITQTVLSRIESGKGNPTLGLLEDVAVALDMRLEVKLSR